MRRWPVLWLVWSVAAAAPSQLETLARAYREAPGAARHDALVRFAAAHKGTAEGSLARLALGVTAYEHKDYSGAIAHLQAVRNLAPLSDYTAYYLASAEAESQDWPAVLRDLNGFSTVKISSPLVCDVLLLRARALEGAGDAKQAEQLLREHYADLRQPAGDAALAAAAQAAGDLPDAVIYYQQAWVRYPDTPEAAQASAALDSLHSALGARYAEPSAGQRLARAARWLDRHDYGRAHAEYQALASQTSGAGRDRARLGVGLADYLSGQAQRAFDYLRSLEAADPAVDAERLYYLEECARHRGDDDAMRDAVERLGRQYPDSPWRLQALIGAANRYLVNNRPDRYEPLYRAAYTDFPNQPQAASCHWKVAWCAYIEHRADAAQLLREHVQRFPDRSTASDALYYLGRLAEAHRDYGAARAWYQKLAGVFPNYYYGMLARDRLAEARVAEAASDERVAAFLRGIAFPAARPPEREPNAETRLRIERAQLLHSAGLSEASVAELRWGVRRDGRPYLLAEAMARIADEPYLRLHFIKTAVPDYLYWKLDEAPRAFWEALFPLPWRADLVRNARLHHLDPFLVAALIRQESEFNPGAISPAHAYGLTQVIPSTGRQIARRVGVRHFTNRSLLVPAINIKLGTYYLRAMLDQWGGQWEQTLASYNAGKTRVADWVNWGRFHSPEEFVESIPFTETREYVQAVLRNARVYRQLYGARRTR